jgi:hypothetical protein
MMNLIPDVVLYVSAFGATLLSLAWIMIMWSHWYGELSVGIVITAVLAGIAMPSWFIALDLILKALST